MVEKSKKASGNGAENKTEDRKIELEEITKPFGPFVSRMSDREVKLGDTTFVLRRLLADAYEYIHAKAARPDGLQDMLALLPHNCQSILHGIPFKVGLEPRDGLAPPIVLAYRLHARALSSSIIHYQPLAII